MHKHRSTQDTVSNQARNSNFDPGTALENLRAEVVDIVALIRSRGSYDPTLLFSGSGNSNPSGEHPLEVLRCE